jgi:hypothetical protein
MPPMEEKNYMSKRPPKVPRMGLRATCPRRSKFFGKLGSERGKGFFRRRFGR